MSGTAQAFDGVPPLAAEYRIEYAVDDDRERNSLPSPVGRCRTIDVGRGVAIISVYGTAQAAVELGNDDIASVTNVALPHATVVTDADT